MERVICEDCRKLRGLDIPIREDGVLVEFEIKSGDRLFIVASSPRKRFEPYYAASITLSYEQMEEATGESKYRDWVNSPKLLPFLIPLIDDLAAMALSRTPRTLWDDAQPFPLFSLEELSRTEAVDA